MVKVILESWREGLEKVSLTKLQIEKLKMSLKESKSNVDSLLNNEKVVLEIDNVNLAKEFYEEAEKIGVNCRLILNA
ncbi:hypothetical protein [Chryseobacterium sp. BIGb0232]|uniref:hypothetical protein n=1 Tax=Chryseobacterium sp. BIGb0232 TaxID=2940598 RepID=UPI000F479BFB|nr:hypothetical protein [Chryseobacterium sp. BIGb0232]MCS4300658.1 peptidyl-tRNA hydrolase [Chryseobacterium sp. BIGb0232]ROS20459.1 hypothetical protein EDF65_1181 [Chryseobacterium nakagawai]